MRIGFDAKRAFLNSTGLGNYARTLIEGLVQYVPETENILYTPKIGTHPFVDFCKKSLLTIEKPRDFLGKTFPAFWRSYLVNPQIRSQQLSLFHGLSNEIPYGLENEKFKVLVTIHDLIFLRYPQFYSALDRKIYELKARRACEKADLIVAISQQTKSDIVHFFGIDENRIKVHYQSPHPQFLTPSSMEDKKRVKLQYHLPDEFILSVGTIEERKNLLLLVKAMGLLPQGQRCPVIVVGRKGAYFQQVEREIQRKNLEKYFTFPNKIPFQDLRHLYSLSTFLAYPSRFEGFGIPLVEALFSDVPSLGAKGSCLEESGGPYNVYTDPDSPEECASLVSLLLSNAQTRRDIIQKNQAFREKFELQRTTANLLSIYTGIV